MNIKDFNKAKQLLSDIKHYEKSIEVLQKALKHQSKFAIYNCDYEFGISLTDSTPLVEKQIADLKYNLENFKEEFNKL